MLPLVANLARFLVAWGVGRAAWDVGQGGVETKQCMLVSNRDHVALLDNPLWIV